MIVSQRPTFFTKPRAVTLLTQSSSEIANDMTVQVCSGAYLPETVSLQSNGLFRVSVQTLNDPFPIFLCLTTLFISKSSPYKLHCDLPYTLGQLFTMQIYVF